MSHRALAAGDLGAMVMGAKGAVDGVRVDIILWLKLMLITDVCV